MIVTVCIKPNDPDGCLMFGYTLAEVWQQLMATSP